MVSETKVSLVMVSRIGGVVTLSVGYLSNALAVGPNLRREYVISNNAGTRIR
jgi:hypothetical protein